ncbi:hypothetical protein HZA43_01650 [Candidatus Peregrinibacteria bacterium]|nr:hypothetical protein [Candidatus Peregrinibacteria bacterium]
MTPSAPTASQLDFVGSEGAPDFLKSRLLPHQRGLFAKATRAAAGGVLLTAASLAAGVMIDTFSEPKIVMDGTRRSIAERLRGYPPSSRAPSEQRVLRGAKFCEGAVRLEGQELEFVQRENVKPGEIFEMNGERFCLEAIRFAGEKDIYYFIRRIGEKGEGAQYAGSDNDGGESGARARFDAAMAAVPSGTTAGDSVLASR